MAEVLKAIGLMSGTSMDGIDVALIETDGESFVRPISDYSVSYEDVQRGIIASALEAAVRLGDRTKRTGVIKAAEDVITEAHIVAVNTFIEQEGVERDAIDVVGFHGQTIIHKPDQRFTVQIGSGLELAARLGLRVVCDMRAADVEAGGQGAPLVPVYHQALAAAVGAMPVAFVNIGGVSNVTFIGANGELVAFDTGPGNALIDDWVNSHTGEVADFDGAIAASGRGQFAPVLLDQLLADPYFSQSVPKSLDRNHFSSALAEGLSLEEGTALLTSFTAASLVRCMDWLAEKPRTWVICGGGRKNTELMRLIREQLETSQIKVRVAEDFGLKGDSVEAEAFAYLAVRSLKGLPLTFPGTTGCPEPLNGGVIFSP